MSDINSDLAIISDTIYTIKAGILSGNVNTGTADSALYLVMRALENVIKNGSI